MEETSWVTARREAWEEIGLPMDDSKLPPPFTIEHLCELPMNLAKTELGVRPCIAFLSASPASRDNEPTTTSLEGEDGKTVGVKNPKRLLAEDILIPRLDAKEVAAVFSAPFHSFLKLSLSDSATPKDESNVNVGNSPRPWYAGSWLTWYQSNWRMHNFYVPLSYRLVTRPRSSKRETLPTLPYGDQKFAPSDPLEGLDSFKVWGMTARIMVDAARLAYGEDPEFEHNSHFGDEELIGKLQRMGRLGAIRKTDDEVTRADVVAASKLA